MGAFFMLAGGVLLNSALYFVFVFVMALLAHNHWAMVTATAGVGVTYLSYYAQLANIVKPTTVGGWIGGLLVVVSIGLGVAAGLMLV